MPADRRRAFRAASTDCLRRAADIAQQLSLLKSVADRKHAEAAAESLRGTVLAKQLQPSRPCGTRDVIHARRLASHRTHCEALLVWNRERSAALGRETQELRGAALELSLKLSGAQQKRRRLNAALRGLDAKVGELREYSEETELLERLSCGVVQNTGGRRRHGG